MPYTVKYLNKATGEPVATEKTVSDNRKAVVTETFVPVSGMLPDAYQKRLVVSAEDGAVNEIIFYYTEDTTRAYYKITHYTENLAKDAGGNPTWTEYASSQAVGDIGTTYTADPMTIPGFTYDPNVTGTVASGELTANGLELKLYYTRISYPYQVRYLEQGTGNQLANPKDGTGKYGQVISESAIDIANYDAVAPTSQTLNIKIEEGTEAKLNIITFYYKEKEVTINYVAVGPEGLKTDGTPNATKAGSVSSTSETLKVLSGTAQGSTPTANTNYHFVGWYTDAACNNPVNKDWVVGNKLTPVKADGTAWTNTTYYAKFAEDQVMINYVVVNNVGGTVTLPSETVNVKSGPVQGSTATANTGYTFKGWFTDESCSEGSAVNPNWVDGNKLTPQTNANGVYEAATYYAKFEENEATINYVAVGPEGLDTNGMPINTVAGSVDPGSETLKVLSDSAKGSTPTANTNYHFVGWYTDASCTTEVNSSWVVGNKLTPVKTDGTAWTNTTYYAKFEEDPATINYVAVGPEGLKTDGTPNDTVAGSVDPGSETLSVISGTAQGSTPTASSATYKFVGWYTDAACTIAVTGTDGTMDATTNKFVPLKTGAVWVDGTTYYAKFEYNLTTLTITKRGLTQTTTDDCESAIITVTDNVTNTVVARVALKNGESVTIDGLTVDRSYTVAEENSWTWRYATVASETITIQPPATGNDVTVNNSQNNYKWLGGDNYKVNVFGTGNN